MIEVRLSGNSFSVERIVCVLDCRRMVHPDIVRSQVEGALLDGLSAALYGEIRLRDGVVEQGNFDRYRLLRLAEVPRLDIELLESGGRPGGVGEPAVPGVAPALVNALRAAGAPPIYELPLSRSLQLPG